MAKLNLKGNLVGWIEAAASFIFVPLENAFPPLAAIGGSIISGFAKQEANLILKECQAFTQRIDDGTSWTDSFNATIAEMKTGELAILSNEAKSFLYMFAHKSKPKAL